MAGKENRKMQIVISNLVRDLMIVEWVIFWQFGIKIELMFLSAFLGVFISFYMPLAIFLIQTIISREHMVNANATIDMVYELSIIIGIGLSGFTLVYAGTKGTLLIDGIFFIISGFFNFAMKVLKIRGSESQNQQNW
ncbi:hypothetical protein QVL58_03290 [Bartonella henselae]|nr:hypothetical protein [Bartonella henselae]